MADEAPRGFFARLWRRRWLRYALLFALVAIPVASIAAAREWHAIHTDPQFCVSCHLMEAPAQKWAVSGHKKIICQTCHQADIFEESRFGYFAFILGKTEIGKHTKLDAAICQGCHIQPGTEWKQIGATPGHRVHVAQRGFSCLECHVTKLHEFRPDTEQCIRCHTDRQGGTLLVGQAPATGAHAKIGKLETTHCLDCHDFLGRKEPVLKPTALTCRSCHAALETAPAKVAAATPPVADPAMARKGRDIWTGKGHADCMGCHRPHGKALEMPGDCLACHKALLEPTNAHYKDERLTECGACHDPHAKSP